MAITGLTVPIEASAAPPRSNVDEAVDVTIELFRQLGVINDEQSLRESLTGDYQRLTELGNGRLYVELPATVTFGRLVDLANKLAQRAGYDAVYRWENFWVPGTEKESVSEDELNGSAEGYTARIALFAEEESGYDPLLHFTSASFDRKYADEGEVTQLDLIEKMQADFAGRQSGASLRACDHRDFLVWYIMDLLRGVKPSEIVLAQGFMRVPVLGRRSVGGGSCVGDVDSGDGEARLDGSDGDGGGDVGVGVSAGFLEA